MPLLPKWGIGGFAVNGPPDTGSPLLQKKKKKKKKKKDLQA